MFRIRMIPVLMSIILVMFTSCSSCGTDHDSQSPTTVPSQVDSGFDFDSEAFTFENFGGDGLAKKLSSLGMQRMFGTDVVCIKRTNPCVLTPQATLWMNETNKTLDQGRSEGFAILSLMFHSGALDPKDFGADSVADLKIANNVPLQEEFAYWATTQVVPSAAKHDVRYQAKEVMPFLAKVLPETSEKHYRLAIAQRTDFGFVRGHALTPIGYFKDNQRKDTYWLRVYDNNFPSHEQVLEIHPKANTWRYEITGVDGENIVYESTKETPNYLYFASIEDREGVLEAPFSKEAEYISQIYSGMTILASNEDGEETGIRDGKVLEAEGDWVRPSFSRCPLCGNAVAIVNQATLAKGLKPKRNITVTAANGVYSTSSGDTTKASVQSYGAGFSSSVEATAPKVGDAVTLGEGGNISYSSKNNEGEVKIASTLRNSDGTNTTVTVKIEGSGGDVSVDLIKAEDGTISISVSGLPEGSKVSITAETLDDEGNSNSNTFEYTSNGEDSQAIVNPSMDNKVTLETNPADAAICRNGTKDPSESDQDCGGSCGATCALGKTCQNDGDCSTGYCESNRCTELDPTCSSGTQSPGETGIDCGGNVCGKCVATVGADTPGCNSANDCDTNLCIEGKCRMKFPVFIEFDQLPDQEKSDFIMEFDGEVSAVSINFIEGKLSYKIGDAYSYKYVNSYVCLPPDSTLRYAGPTVDNPTRMTGVLQIICPEEEKRHMIVSLSHSLIVNDIFSKLESDPIKMLLSVDGEPPQLVEIKDPIVNLGEYQEKWAIKLIQTSANKEIYDLSSVGISGRPKRGIRVSMDYNSERNNEWTDLGYLFVVKPDLTEASFTMLVDESNPPSCNDRIHNQDETSVDCGGGCQPCSKNGLCLSNSDCQNGLICLNYICLSDGSCSDGIQNRFESDVDCGGDCVGKCDMGENCYSSRDCDETAGLACVEQSCQLAVCNNGVKDPNESDVDCGGSSVCGACGDGKTCLVASDCSSATCLDNICVPATCVNGVWDGGETDVDCGGAAGCPRCARTRLCQSNSDCRSDLICPGGVGARCYSLDCENGVKDPEETDVDCGAQCSLNSCAPGKTCQTNDDCFTTAICSNNLCIPAECGNNMKDANESDIDCGGSSICERCAGGQSCTMDGDCVMGNLCISNQCASPDCNNNTQDPGEADVDCGAVCMDKCSEGKMCGSGADCQLGLVCDNGTCKDASCFNQMKDPSEGDIDCGGSCDAKCMIGQSCNQSSDCAAGVACNNGTCTMDLCSNGVKDQDETDVDCGGMTCGTCMAGQSCTFDSDCAMSDCVCGANSGNCSGASGTCGAGQFFLDQPVTDGTTASGTYMIPGGCTSLYVQAWGAAGGAIDQMGFPSLLGGAGGYVEGTLTVSPGDVATVWLGQGGTSGFSVQGSGSYLGVPAVGGDGGFGMFGADPGGGGGLTSIQITGSVTHTFTVPAGAGGSDFGNPMIASVMVAPGTTTTDYSGDFGNDDEGGGGAGEPGGASSTAGAYGTLPIGLVAHDSVEDVNLGKWVPAGTSNNDYNRCVGTNSIAAGTGDEILGVGGDGCVVLRCVAP